MMAVDFEGTNLHLKKPNNMTDEECYSLDAFKGVTTDGFPLIRTKWMPSKEDLEALNSGRGFWIDILSHTFAPIAVFTVDENDEINE